MAKYINIHIVGTVPGDDEYVGYEAILAARGPFDAVVEALTARGIGDIKAEARLVERRIKPPVMSGEAAVRAVRRGAFDPKPASGEDDEAA